jgi:hypothetical protein
MLSAEVWVRWVVGKRCLPRIPIKTATPSEITTHTIAILLEETSSFSRLIAIKRRST